MPKKIDENKIEKKYLEYVSKSEEKITDDDIKKVIDAEYKVIDNIKKKGTLEKLIDKIILLFSLLKDYIKGNYKEIPKHTIVAIVIALAYLINPSDLIPDFIPVVGYIDDATVIGLCIKLVGKDLDKYEEWKNQNN